MRSFDYFKVIIKNWKSKLKSNLFDFPNDSRVFKRKNLLEVLKIVNKVGFSRFTFDLISNDLPSNKKIVIVAPHPDDEVIGLGGTLLRLLREKCTVEIIYMTSGKLSEKKIREQELKNVCTLLNVRFHIIGGVAGDKLFGSEKIAEVIKNLNPGIIFMPFILDDNADHRKTHNQLIIALKGLSNKNKINNIKIWSYQIYGPIIVNKVIDISNVINHKKKLIKLYKSQFKSRDWEHYTTGMNAWNSRFLSNRNKVWAECFFVQSMKDYKNFYYEIFR